MISSAPISSFAVSTFRALETVTGQDTTTIIAVGQATTKAKLSSNQVYQVGAEYLIPGDTELTQGDNSFALGGVATVQILPAYTRAHADIRAHANLGRVDIYGVPETVQRNINALGSVQTVLLGGVWPEPRVITGTKAAAIVATELIVGNQAATVTGKVYLADPQTVYPLSVAEKVSSQAAYLQNPGQIGLKPIAAEAKTGSKTLANVGGVYVANGFAVAAVEVSTEQNAGYIDLIGFSVGTEPIELTVYNAGVGILTSTAGNTETKIGKNHLANVQIVSLEGMGYYLTIPVEFFATSQQLVNYSVGTTAKIDSEMLANFGTIELISGKYRVGDISETSIIPYVVNYSARLNG